MRVPLPFERSIRRALPRTLLGRSLLIILVPLILIQAVALQDYYGNHLNLVYRRLSGGVAGELAFTLQLLDRTTDPAERQWVTETARHEFDLRMRFEPGARLADSARINVLGPMDDDLQAALAEKLVDPFTMDWTYDPQSVLIRVQLQ